MVHYKLKYNNARGLGETARQIFLLAGQDYEDFRITPEEFQDIKHERYKYRLLFNNKNFLLRVGVPAFPIQYEVTYWEALAGNKNQFYSLGAFDGNNNLMGFASLIRNVHSFFKTLREAERQLLRFKRCSCIPSIAVDEKYRGQGLGSELLRRLVAYSEQSGYHLVYLHVNYENEAAKRFYEKNGFKEEIKIEDYYPPGTYPHPRGLVYSAPLPSGGWKTAIPPRRDNNPVPPPPSDSRPRVDSSALQHAAARLHNVPNLSHGRVDGQNQQLLNGNRQNSQIVNQLDLNQTGEQVHATPAHSYHTDTLSDLRRYPYKGLDLDAPPTAPPPAPPINATAFDSTPKNLYQTFNSPTSNSYINNHLPAQQPTATYTPVYQSPYSTINRETRNTVTSVNQSGPNQTLEQPIRATNNGYSTPQVYQSPLTSNYGSVSPNYAPAATQQAPKTSYTSNTSSTFRSVDPSGNQTTKVHTSNYNNGNTRETVMEYTTPYNSSVSPSNGAILDPRSRIHDYATQNYVNDESSQQYRPSGLQRIFESFSSSAIRNESSKFSTTPQRNPNDLARELRDSGLTYSQKMANQNQRSQLRKDDLPFDPNRIIQDSYRGDEIDSLVSRMQTNLNTTSTTRTNTMQRSNICVACKNEITADKPGCTALDQVFHVSCFKCQKCARVLAGSSFYNMDNLPICEGCYTDSLEKCTKCHKAINDKLLRACGGTYHVACFTCCSCYKILEGVPFTTDNDNNVHCVPCFHDRFAPRCAVCSRGIIPVEGEKESVRVVAMDKSFHVECYRCEDCGMQLSSKIEGQGCYPLDQHLLCKTCNSNRLRMTAGTMTTA